MKGSISKFLRYNMICFAVLSCVGANATIQKFSAVPVEEGSELTQLPPTEALQAGTLKEGSQLYDLLCTGKCSLTTQDMQLKVDYAPSVPSLVAISKAPETKGQVVFAEPKPMCTLSLPGGHDAYITITLEKMKGNFGGDVVKYLALGVRKKGADDFLSVLCIPDENPAPDSNNNPWVGLHMLSDSVVELVPLISKENMSGANGYVPVKVGSLVGELTPLVTSNTFDFGTVFRTDFKCNGSKIEIDENKANIRADGIILDLSELHNTYGSDLDIYCSSISYVDNLFLVMNDNNSYNFIIENYRKYRTTNICNATSITCVTNGTERNYIALCTMLTTTYNIAMSQDCISWKNLPSQEKKLASIFPDDFSYLMVSLDNEILAISGQGWQSRSPDGINDWSRAVQALEKLYLNSGANSAIMYLCFGNGILIAGNQNGNISISRNRGDVWDRPVKLEGLDTENRWDGGLTFGNGMFLAASGNGKLLCSADGVNWTSLGTLKDKSGNEIHTTGVAFGDDAFYAITSSGDTLYKFDINFRDLAIQ